ncbi:MAG: hypothetical protein JW795_13310, partial [Chitinivibrionales bacterium]|nr:hypothetical protein [Chitinivibrionales bacterium]
DKEIILITADLGFKVLDDFISELPGQFINAGVAEQNMISMAAGLAMAGKKVFCYSMVPFITMRAFEQVRVDICSHSLGVTLVGVGGGLSYGMEGMTHHGFEDISLMRSLPGMTVTAPGDPVECEAIVKQSINFAGPLYIRLGKNNDPQIHRSETIVNIGEGIVLEEGKDACVILTGSMLALGSQLVQSLATQGVRSTLVSFHTVKPLDTELLDYIINRHKIIFTLEEHSIVGGLGSAVAEYLAESDFSGCFKRFGLPDEYCQSIGDHKHLLNETGLTVAQITNEMKKMCC